VILRIPGTEVILGLVQVTGRAAESLSLRRTGLDYPGSAVSSRGELKSWAARRVEQEVVHSEVVETTTNPMINVTDPDDIALAIAPPPSRCSDLTIFPPESIHA
jgi:hypothetical protein